MSLMVSHQDVKCCLLQVAIIGQAGYNGCLWARLLGSLWDEHGKQTNTFKWCVSSVKLFHLLHLSYS